MIGLLEPEECILESIEERRKITENRLFINKQEGTVQEPVSQDLLANIYREYGGGGGGGEATRDRYHNKNSRPIR